MEPAARVVETPVFLHPVPGVPVALHGVVPAPGAPRGHFQHELGRLTDLAYHVTVAADNRLGIHPEGYHAIGGQLLPVIGGFTPQVSLARYQNVITMGKVEAQEAGGRHQVLVLLHVRLPWGIRQRLQVGVVGKRQLHFARTGHGAPLE